MSKKHEGYVTACERCGGKHCPDCDSSCPSCCLHEDCIAVKERDAALEALEGAQEALQSWEEGTHPAIVAAQAKIEELSRQVGEAVWIEEQRENLRVAVEEWSDKWGDDTTYEGAAALDALDRILRGTKEGE